MNTTRTALVLGSGSARGLAHIGVLKVLERECVPIDIIVGTSIGALIGGAYASGMPVSEIEDVALSMDVRRLVSFADIALPSTAFVNGSRIEAFIRDVVGGKTFADVRVPFACVAADLQGECEVVFNEGDLAQAIRASISVPIIFAPVQDGERFLVDGGVVNPVPVDVARAMGGDFVIASTVLGVPSCNVREGSDGVPTSGARRRAAGSLPQAVRSKVVSFAKETVQRPAVYQAAIGSADLMQRKLSEYQLRDADLVIAPIVAGASFYSFHDAKRIIALGENAAKTAVAEMRSLARNLSA